MAVPDYVAILQRLRRTIHGYAASQQKTLLHAAIAKAILQLADALRRTAFLDVSSLNFGGAKSTAVFLCA